MSFEEKRDNIEGSGIDWRLNIWSCWAWFQKMKNMDRYSMNRIFNFQLNSDDRLDIIAIKILMQKSKMMWKQEIESSFKYVYLFWKSFNILSVSTSNWTFHNETQVWIIQITKPFVAFSFQEAFGNPRIQNVSRETTHPRKPSYEIPDHSILCDWPQYPATCGHFVKFDSDMLRFKCIDGSSTTNNKSKLGSVHGPWCQKTPANRRGSNHPFSGANSLLVT